MAAEEPYSVGWAVHSGAVSVQTLLGLLNGTGSPQVVRVYRALIRHMPISDGQAGYGDAGINTMTVRRITGFTGSGPAVPVAGATGGNTTVPELVAMRNPPAVSPARQITVRTGVNCVVDTIMRRVITNFSNTAAPVVPSGIYYMDHGVTIPAAALFNACPPVIEPLVARAGYGYDIFAESVTSRVAVHTSFELTLQ